MHVIQNAVDALGKSYEPFVSSRLAVKTARKQPVLPLLVALVPWASNVLKIVDISENSWILSSRNAQETAGKFTRNAQLDCHTSIMMC